MEGIKKAFESFMENEFEDTVDSSTEASWDGNSYYVVELFEDGSYRTIWSMHVGNRYESKGMFLRVPILGDEEWDDDKDLRFYDYARENMQDTFEECLKLYSIYQLIEDEA